MVEENNNYIKLGIFKDSNNNKQVVFSDMGFLHKDYTRDKYDGSGPNDTDIDKATNIIMPVGYGNHILGIKPIFYEHEPKITQRGISLQFNGFLGNSTSISTYSDLLNRLTIAKDSSGSIIEHNYSLNDSISTYNGYTADRACFGIENNSRYLKIRYWTDEGAQFTNPWFENASSSLAVSDVVSDENNSSTAYIANNLYKTPIQFTLNASNNSANFRYTNITNIYNDLSATAVTAEGRIAIGDLPIYQIYSIKKSNIAGIPNSSTINLNTLIAFTYHGLIINASKGEEGPEQVFGLQNSDWEIDDIMVGSNASKGQARLLNENELRVNNFIRHMPYGITSIVPAPGKQVTAGMVLSNSTKMSDCTDSWIALNGSKRMLELLVSCNANNGGIWIRTDEPNSSTSTVTGQILEMHSTVNGNIATLTVNSWQNNVSSVISAQQFDLGRTPQYADWCFVKKNGRLAIQYTARADGYESWDYFEHILTNQTTAESGDGALQKMQEATGQFILSSENDKLWVMGVQDRASAGFNTVWANLFSYNLDQTGGASGGMGWHSIWTGTKTGGSDSGSIDTYVEYDNSDFNISSATVNRDTRLAITAKVAGSNPINATTSVGDIPKTDQSNAALLAHASGKWWATTYNVYIYGYRTDSKIYIRSYQTGGNSAERHSVKHTITQVKQYYDDATSSCSVTLRINTGINAIHYKAGSSDEWHSTTTNTTISVPSGTTIYYYVDVATGFYTATSTDQNNPNSKNITGNTTISPKASTTQPILQCIADTTNILTANGYKKASEIKQSDLLAGYKNNKIEYALVQTIYRGKDNSIYELELTGNNKLQISGKHPILTDTGYKTIENNKYDFELLSIGDSVLTINGTYGIVAINKVNYNKEFMYNFYTELDNFIANDIIVACEDNSIDKLCTQIEDGSVVLDKPHEIYIN